ncbi:DUF7553 family protein [Haloprofundus halobius]|uniref:DUF7553 family protein n=1 Tax=Haloprofundus halobius TaxID=2876194 RepID=UPI001CCD9E9A|nr:hypothetical protein [Haloprofundus halobius]
MEHSDEPIAAARAEIRRASDRTDGETREQLLSLDEGLMELGGGDKVESDGPPKEDRVEQVEETLVGLANELDDDHWIQDRLETARDYLDQYRQERGVPTDEGR